MSPPCKITEASKKLEMKKLYQVLVVIDDFADTPQLHNFFLTRAPWGIKPSVTKTTKQSSAVRRVRPKGINAGETIKTEKEKPETQRNKPQAAKRDKEQRPFPSRAKWRETSRCGI